MPIPVLPTIFLAVGPEIWTYPAWQLRTNNLIPPFDSAATPDNTYLEEWQLTLVQQLVHHIHSLPNYSKRIHFIRRTQKPNSKYRHAYDAWNTWVNAHLQSWNIESTIEDIFHACDRHPSFLVKSSPKLRTPIKTYDDAQLGKSADWVAVGLFGLDAFVDPWSGCSWMKLDVLKFTLELLRIIWNTLHKRHVYST